jgi:hypothetical protein
MESVDFDDSDTNECEGTVSPLVEDDFSFREVAHDCRLTFSYQDRPQDKDLKCLEDKNWIAQCKRHARHVIDKAVALGYFARWTAGIERYNRKGEACKLHLHLRFISDKQTPSMRKEFKRVIEALGHDTRGNVNFMFKACVIRNETDFYGYPLKMNLNTKLCGGFTVEALNALHMGSKSEYIKVCEHVQKKMDRTDKKDTLYQTIISRISKLDIGVTKTKRVIANEFLKYYIENELPINGTVIKGYVLTASLHFKLITPDNLLDEWGY